MFHSCILPSSTHPDRQSVYHTLGARMGQVASGTPLTGVEPLELKADGQVDSFMLAGSDQAITSLSDPRISDFRANGTVAPGWTPIGSSGHVTGFENEQQSFQLLSARNPQLTTQLQKGEQVWVHSLSERQEGLVVEEPFSDKLEGSPAYEFVSGERQGQTTVCVLGDRYVEVADAPTLDGPFLEALQSRENVWTTAFSPPASSLQEAWNLSEKSVIGQQGRRAVAHDASGRWVVSQEVELDTEKGRGTLRVTLPGEQGHTLEQTLQGDFAGGRLVPDSVVKALRVRS